MMDLYDFKKVKQIILNNRDANLIQVCCRGWSGMYSDYFYENGKILVDLDRPPQSVIDKITPDAYYANTDKFGGIEPVVSIHRQDRDREDINVALAQGGVILSNISRKTLVDQFKESGKPRFEHHVGYYVEYDPYGYRVTRKRTGEYSVVNDEGELV